MGRILEAHDEQLDRPVAIKEMLVQGNAELELRFEREVILTARLHHPSILKVIEAGKWETGEPFYVMPLVRGRSLAAALADSTTLLQRVALLPHLIAAAEAVAYAHAERILHRDLKPANILIGDFGETLVIDWGLAKVLEQSDVSRAGARTVTLDPMLTRAGDVVGTPAYMAPEQAAGGAVDTRADVWAIGACLHQLLTGRAPGDARPARNLTPMVAAPAELVAVAEKAMATDASNRYPSAAHLVEDLRRYQAGRLVQAHRYTLAQRVSRKLRQNRVAVLVGASLATLLLVVAAYSARRIVMERDTANRERDVAIKRKATAEKLVDFFLGDIRLQATRLKNAVPAIEVDGAGVPIDSKVHLSAKNAALMRRAAMAMAAADRHPLPEGSIRYSAEHGKQNHALWMTAGLRDDYGPAQTLLNDVVSSDPDNEKARLQVAEAQSHIGDIYIEQGNTSRAFDAYRQTIRLLRSVVDRAHTEPIAPKLLAHAYVAMATAEQGVARSPTSDSILNESLTGLQQLNAAGKLDGDGVASLKSLLSSSHETVAAH